MADKSKSGDQTEKATPKRLRDARNRGEIAKSKDLTSVLVLGAWVALGFVMWRPALDGLNAPLRLALDAVSDPAPYQMKAVGMASLRAFVEVSLLLMIPVAIVGMLAEFAQAGPILTFEKMAPKLDHMNPAEGLKRMFSKDNLFEVAKSLVKAALAAAVIWFVVTGEFRALGELPQGGASGAMGAMGGGVMQLAIAVAIAFAAVSGADIAYQRFAFAKRMRMSKREIKQEMKDAEGDSMLKGRRRQLHQEWSSRNVVQAARGATALVMNPTHIAVALAYDPEAHPAPVVTGKGLGSLALEMRSAAEEEGVPIIRNVEVARALNARAPLDDIVPADLFAAVAEVIVFARRLRAEAEREAAAREAAERAGAPGAQGAPA